MRLPPSSDARPYVEALPRFNILKLDKQFREGAAKLHWYDQDGAGVGMANVVRLDRHAMELSFVLNEIGYVAFANAQAA